MAKYRFGVDVGGTHTDCVLLNVDDGTIAVEKVPSTPANPALGVLDGLSRFLDKGVPSGGIEFFAHGTTITTNALLEMRGAKVGLLITKGFRAIQEVQSQVREGNPFDYYFEKPAPIAPQSVTFEIPERVDFGGNILTPIDVEAVRAAAREFRQAGIESIAVSFLFSFMNPEHERLARAILLEEFPDAHVSLSSDVLPRIREWPRMSTTLLNAYLEPILVRYIGHLSDGLDKNGVETQQRFLMQSNGGVMPFAAVGTGGKTVYTLLSGPAAGAQASAHLSADAERGLVTLDMGGTSCDIAFIEGGAPVEATESSIDRRPVHVPSLDITTISAGGGSIASIDRGGLLCVGPKSAGADPGPACYGKGGQRPTVTDADLVCGFLNPEYFLGGTQRLDVGAAEGALKRHVADPAKLSVPEAAIGIRKIVDLRMADQVRVVAAKRGTDAQEYTLLPFGGAGAVHAAAVADDLGIRRILVPPRPGAFSALGLLCTDVVHDYIRSDLRPLAMVEPVHAEQALAALEQRARDELAAEGLDAESAQFHRELDMRYAGQGYELRVSLQGLGAKGITAEDLDAVRDRFHAAHARAHGHAAYEKPLEIVSYRVRVRVPVPKYEPRPTAPNGKASVDIARKGDRQVYFTSAEPVETAVYDRDLLQPGHVVHGPAILEQLDATTVVPIGWTCEIDAHRNALLTRT